MGTYKSELSFKLLSGDLDLSELLCLQENLEMQ